MICFYQPGSLSAADAGKKFPDTASSSGMTELQLGVQLGDGADLCGRDETAG
jgi:hypothetical protein